MAELSPRDRLQPALLDRLTDDGRILTVYRVRTTRDRLVEHGFSEDELERAMVAQGLRLLGPRSESEGGLLTWEYVASGPSLRRLAPRKIRLRRAVDQRELPLTIVCDVDASTMVNSQPEPLERRAISMTRLRDAVLRDLGWLFNASGVDDLVDLEPYPEVRRSVVNFGLRSLAGRPASSINANEVSRRIRDAVSWFEPRLSHVRVTPELSGGPEEGMLLTFLVEAELWGQPVSQHVALRTCIDTETGDVTVSDRAGRA